MADVKIFVDFWNFQLSWNRHVRPEPGSDLPYVRIGWRELPGALIGELPAIVGTGSALQYRGTNVYASVNPQAGSKDEGLKKFLHGPMASFTGFRPVVKDRRPKTEECPHCGDATERMIEKGVDASIITDLFEGAINNSYEIAVLLTNDSDLVPAIETIQERLNRQIIHAGFRGTGDFVRGACWGHVMIEGDVVDKLSD